MAAAGAPQQPNAQFSPVLQNRPLQIAIGVGLLILIVAGVIFFFVNSSRDLGPYQPLVTGVDQARALEIAAELNSQGIETEIIGTDTGGVTINVREKQMDNAVLEMARSNLLLTDDFKLFDKTDWAASDYEKRVKYMRAVGGELSRLISRMEGIRWAKAHVTIPPEKLFTSRYIKDKTSASVTVEMEPGRTLNREQVSSIISLVSGYVPEIEPNRISIIDTKGRVYSSASPDGEDSIGGSGNFDWAGKSSVVNSTIEKRIQDYLDGVLGPGKSRVAVSTVLTTRKTTQNITKFTPGAIGTHEYSEEALGDGAKGSPYTGTEMLNNNAPPPRPVDEYGNRGNWQSQGNEMVDSRLQKDMPPEFYQRNFKPNAFKDPSGRSYNPCTGGPNDGPMCYENTGRDPSLQPSPTNQAQGLYSMGSQNWGGKGQQGYLNQNYQSPNSGQVAGSNVPVVTAPDARYVCAAGDEACLRNYRRHNFAIQSYPSFEQTMIESPSGAVSQIRVSVAVEKGSLPVSIGKLKAGIAAAADPNMLSSEVEVILTPPKAKKEEPKKNNNSVFLTNESGGFQWWWIPALILVIILVFLVFRAIGSLLVGKPKTFRDRVPFPAPSPSPKQSNPLDRLDFGNQAPVFKDDVPPPPPATPRPAEQPPSNQQPVPNFEQEGLTPPNNQSRQSQGPQQNQEEIPLTLDDEFSVNNPPPPQASSQAPPQSPTRSTQQAPQQPQIRQQRQRPKVVIEDNGAEG